MHRAWTIVLVVVAVGALLWLATRSAWGQDPVAAAVPDSRSPRSAEPAVSAPPIARSDVHETDDRVESGARATLTGSVRWADGAPAVGAVVAADATSTGVLTDAGGTFHLPGVPAASEQVTLWVKPACWREPARQGSSPVTSRSADALHLAPVELPLVGDVAVHVALSDPMFAVLSRCGAAGLVLNWSLPPAVDSPLPFRTQVRSDSFHLAPTNEVVARMPFRVGYRAVLLAEIGAGKREQVGSCAFDVRRDAVAACTIAVAEDRVLAGRVIDQDGLALPDAYLQVRQPVPGGGGRNFRVELAPDGSFVFLGDPAQSHELLCRFEGAETRLGVVPLAQTDLQVVVDLSTLCPFVLTRGRRPIEHYYLGSAFTRVSLPELQRHEGGRGWIHAKGTGFADAFPIFWLEDGKVHELCVPRPESPGRDPYVIDVDRFDVQPSGEIRLLFRGRQRVLVNLQRVQPDTPWPVNAPRQLLGGSGRDQHLLGILPGKYSVKVELRRGEAPPFEREVFVDVFGDVVDVDIAAVLDGR